MDAVANVVHDLVLAQCDLPPLVNVVHPRPVSWKHVMDAFNASLGSEPLPVVPFTEWLDKLEQVALRADNEDASTTVSLASAVLENLLANLACSLQSVCYRFSATSPVRPRASQSPVPINWQQAPYLHMTRQSSVITVNLSPASTRSARSTFRPGFGGGENKDLCSTKLYLTGHNITQPYILMYHIQWTCKCIIYAMIFEHDEGEDADVRSRTKGPS